MTLIIIAEHLAVQVSLPVVKARSVVAGIRSNPLSNRRGERGGGLESMIFYSLLDKTGK